jgi:cytochrome c-type biogenesis protein CcmH
MSGRRFISLFLVAGLLAGAGSPAGAQTLDGAQEGRAQRLFTEVRCVQCQGQSIGDSEAPIAVDMRDRIRAEIASGATDAQIRDALYQRYGDYVLFRPRLSMLTLVLWVLPLLILAAGAGLALVMLRRSAAQAVDQPDETELDAVERARLERLLQPPE